MTEYSDNGTVVQIDTAAIDADLRQLAIVQQARREVCAEIIAAIDGLMNTSEPEPHGTGIEVSIDRLRIGARRLGLEEARVAVAQILYGVKK